MKDELVLEEVFFNTMISDIALDLGEFKLEEEANVLPDLQSGNQ